MFVTYILNKINHTYRIFLFILMVSLLSTSFSLGERQSQSTEKESVSKESPLKKTPSQQESIFEKTEHNAVVPAVQLDIQKIAILYRKILIGEAQTLDALPNQNITLPKLLQTLLTTAIQNNAP